jgi:hypothetical protein
VDGREACYWISVVTGFRVGGRIHGQKVNDREAGGWTTHADHELCHTLLNELKACGWTTHADHGLCHTLLNELKACGWTTHADHGLCHTLLNELKACGWTVSHAWPKSTESVGQGPSI